ncbi:hypothetical protein C1645_773552 [Glomus cerebriforme]|uniref:Uncharacterized protein n=1 Tax=Glomus cerebriforme TaxID=658196 RepID=A0A397T1E5_9GLOM|nr:hypothetical protein C1645_773552 [Glomus cerebriforme]
MISLHVSIILLLFSYNVSLYFTRSPSFLKLINLVLTIVTYLRIPISKMTSLNNSSVSISSSENSSSITNKT